MNTMYNIVVPYVKSPILSCSIFCFLLQLTLANQWQVNSTTSVYRLLVTMKMST